MEQTANSDLFDLRLDQSSINYLGETARWSKFLAIIGFIYCGLLVICGLFIGSIMSAMMPVMGDSGMSTVGSVFIGVFVIAMSLLLFFPALFLYKFSVKTKQAINSNDQPVLTDALKNLKSFFKFYGIIVIIFLSIYLLAFVAGMIGALVGHR